MEDVHIWLKNQRDGDRLTFKRIQLSESREWKLEKGTIVHNTGRFYRISGLKCHQENESYCQPIIDQWEVGILGFLIHGYSPSNFEILCQAKTEPGNVNQTQIAPTFQATRSNYERLHGGDAQPFAQYFLEDNGLKNSTTVVDELQSEQGFRFWKKRNRNWVIKISSEDKQGLCESDAFRWIGFEEILELSKCDYVLNTDFRSVLVQLVFGSYFQYGRLQIDWLKGDSILAPDKNYVEDKKWLDNYRLNSTYTSELIGLEEMYDWKHSDYEIASNAFEFGVSYFDVDCNREVGNWDQPLMTSKGEQFCGLIITNTDQIYLLLQARFEPGLRQGAELSCTYHSDHFIDQYFFSNQVDYVSIREQSQIITHCNTSEEGGRFFLNKTRNEIIQVESKMDVSLPSYRWISLNSICHFVNESCQVNNELRTMLSILLGSDVR